MPVLLVLVPEPRHLLPRAPNLRRFVRFHLVQPEVRHPLHAPRARLGVRFELLVDLHGGLECIGKLVQKLLEVTRGNNPRVLHPQRSDGVAHLFTNRRHPTPPLFSLLTLLQHARVTDLRLPRGVLRPLLHLLRAVAAVKPTELIPVLRPAQIHLGAVIANNSPVIVQRRLNLHVHVPVLVIRLGLDLGRFVVRAALPVPHVTPHRRE